MINNFPVNRSYSPGGYQSFLYVPFQYVAAYPIINNGQAAAPVSLKAGGQWLQGYATRETLNLTEEPQISEHGTYYKPVISGFVPGESANLIAVMEGMDPYRFMVIMKDAIGRMRLVGTPAMPLNFSANFSSGSGRSDSKGFNFKFFGDTLNRAPMYNW